VAMAAVFAPGRRFPVGVGAAAIAVYVARLSLDAGPEASYAYQIAVVLMFFAAAAGGSGAPVRIAGRLLVLVALTVGARALVVLVIEPGEPFLDPYGRAIWIYLGALAGAGAALGLTLRGRDADVRALRRRVELLEAALPTREDDAARAEQRRAAEHVRRLVVDLAERVETLLADAGRTLRRDPRRAALLLVRTGDAARETLAGMRALLHRLRSDEGEDEAPAGAAVRPGAATVEDLVDGLQRDGAEVAVRRDPRLAVPEVLVIAADRVAVLAADVLGGPPRHAALRVTPTALELVLRGPRRRRRPPAATASADGVAVAERVRLLGGALRLRARRGRLVLVLPLEGAPARRGSGHALPDVPAPLRGHGGVALLAALGALDQLVEPIDGPLAVRLAVAVLLPLPLLARRRRPVLAVLGLEAVLVAGSAGGILGGLAAQAYVATLIAAFMIGASPLRLPTAAAVGAAAVVLPNLAMLLEPTAWTAQSYVSYAAMLAGAWIVGRLVRDRLAAAAGTRAQLDRLDARRRAIEERAAGRERARLARELHDVLGHAILVICIQAGAAERMAERGDDSGAQEAIASARAASATALRELDRLARLTPAAPAGDTAPGLGELPALVDRVRATGVEVELRLVASEPVPDAVGAAAYRIVQEALTNAAKHAAGAPVTVGVEVGEGRLALRVANPSGEALAAAPGGHGLRSMAERAGEHGGALEAGPADGGGWTVRASLPLAPRAGQTTTA
ncbi:MAG TPA: histidine kinase, partial [Solirubrobacteraceae bacterium]